MAVTITQAPNVAVSSLSTPNRTAGGSYAMTSALNIGGTLLAQSSNRRATKVDYGWSLLTSESVAGSQTVGMISVSTQATHTLSANLNSFNGLTRSSFYPLTNVKLQGVTVWARPGNMHGSGPTTAQTRTINVPVAPVISDYSVSAGASVSCTITSDAGQGNDERYRTRYKMTVYNTRTRTTTVRYDTSSTNTTMSLSYDVTDYQQLSYGDYVQITTEAWNQGFAGDSVHVTKTFYMSYPAQTTIKDVQCSSTSSTGKTNVLINTNSSTQHPVDEVSLEYLANTTYEKASDISGSASWSSHSITDNAACTALSIPNNATGFIPDAGKYTWVRVKSERSVLSSTLVRYSEPARVRPLETPAPTASDDEIKIISTSLGADAKSIAVLMGWDISGTDDSTGTELSWADAEDAWRSTDQPSTFEFDWSDGSYTDTSVTPNVTYQKSATIVIKNLEYGQSVYVKARRFMDYEGDRTYGEYCNAKALMPSSSVAGIPEGVTFYAPGYIPRDGTVTLSWEVGGLHEQRTWAIVTASGANIAYGTGTTNSAKVDASRLAEFATNNVVTLHVEVTTGGDPISSTAQAIKIVDYPTLALTVGSSLTAQPFSFTATTNISCRIVATITALGTGGQNPGGTYEQYAGDTVWSDELLPIYTAGQNSTLVASITLDKGQNFIDGQRYRLTVQAFDDTTGLSSEKKSAEFGVAWSHQAKAAESCTVTPANEYDSDGVHHVKATIAIVAPTGANQYDRYDVYRCSGEGAYLIGSDYPASYTAVDEYAPFGDGANLFYRIATRTVDGDVEFADIPYTLNAKMLRFDWPSGSLELPYNIEISDGYSKNVAFRMHQEGVYNAYWNPGVTHTSRHSSQIVRIDGKGQVAAARQLARYPGSVMVRTPEGNAFEADVQISEMSTSGVIQLFSLSITEIEPTGAYDLAPYVSG